MKKKILNHLFFLVIVLLSIKISYSQRFQTSEEIIGFCNSIDRDMRYVGSLNPDSIPILPIGIHKEIAGVKYTIAIDSAKFKTNGAFFDAYMAIQIPGMDQKIAFRATNIQFNPKGVIGGAQSKLYLASDQRIRFGPKIDLLFPGDGSNYVEWDCNGFKAINLKGVFEFSNELLEPLDTSSKVKAGFEVYTSDIRNVLITATITPFQLKGKKDFQFFVQEAVLDLSDDFNPPNAIFPNQTLESFSGDVSKWRGFYLKSIEVVMPEELSRGSDRISVGVNNLFIDNSGFSGEVFVNNLLTTQEGDLSGWPFSVTRLEATFVCNKIVAGGIQGVVNLPAVEQTDIEYSAEIMESQSGGVDYNFSISPTEPLHMKSAGADFVLDPSSRLEIRKLNGKFSPKLVVTGDLTIKKNKTEIAAMRFQDITFVTNAPYITDGVFDLTTEGDNNKMENFNIQLERFYIHFSETAPVFGANVRLNLSKKPDDQGESGFSLSVASGFKVFTKITEIPESEFSYYPKLVWEYDRFQIANIGIDVQTNALHLKGALSFRRNDPVYGDGFFGAMYLKIKNVLDDPLSATFFAGKVDDYRYWFVDISVPVNIPLGNTGLKINKLRGGASYHVKDTRTKEELIASANQGAYVSSNTYVPNRDIGLSLRAGVGLDWLNPTALNADVLFSITFNSHGGFNEIYFLGNVFCLVPRNDRGGSSNKIEGQILIHYDNVEKILDARVDAQADFADVVKGSLNLRMYFSPDLWFVKLNTPQNPANVNLLDIAFIDTYLMIGEQLESSLPPPASVLDLVGIESSESRDQEAILLGNGFAHGSRVQVGGEVSFGWQNFSIYGALDIGAGYDLTIYKYPLSVHCEGMSGPIGMKGWYLQGQIYSYVGFGVGIRGKIFGTNYDLPLIEAYLAMYLSGKLPNPSYVEGGVGVRVTLIGILPLKFNFNFSVGEQCNIVQT